MLFLFSCHLIVGPKSQKKVDASHEPHRRHYKYFHNINWYQSISTDIYLNSVTWCIIRDVNENSGLPQKWRVSNNNKGGQIFLHQIHMTCTTFQFYWIWIWWSWVFSSIFQTTFSPKILFCPKSVVSAKLWTCNCDTQMDILYKNNSVATVPLGR